MDGVFRFHILMLLPVDRLEWWLSVQKILQQQVQALAMVSIEYDKDASSNPWARVTFSFGDAIKNGLFVNSETLFGFRVGQTRLPCHRFGMA